MQIGGAAASEEWDRMCETEIHLHNLLVVSTPSTQTVCGGAMPHCAMPCCARHAGVQFDVWEERFAVQLLLLAKYAAARLAPGGVAGCHLAALGFGGLP
jgi:hypothetical protein